MARDYTITMPSTTPGAAKTLVECLSGTNHSFQLLRVNLSADNTAGTKVVRVNVTLITGTGTGTANTPAKNVSDDTAFTGNAKVNDTVEPTKSTVLNRRWWNTITECDIPLEDKGYIFKAGGAEGFNVELLDDPAGNVVVVCHIREL